LAHAIGVRSGPRAAHGAAGAPGCWPPTPRCAALRHRLDAPAGGAQAWCASCARQRCGACKPIDVRHRCIARSRCTACAQAAIREHPSGAV